VPSAWGCCTGTYCLGCCWLLSAILFPLGIMNMAAMAVITLLVFAEKTLPWGRAVVRLVAFVSWLTVGRCWPKPRS
jgi:predicted metal-binding membrane protein